MTNTVLTKAASALIAVALTTTSFTEVASAQTYDFKFATSELASEEGVSKLQKRVRNFARNACRTSPLHTPAMRKECRQDMEAQLRSKIFTAGNRQPLK